MIIGGFAGIGKSTLCCTKPSWIDLESTPFEKDFDRYTKVANHMNVQGYNVMLSCHSDLRKTLYNKNIPYILVLPNPSLKEEYIARYKARGNAEMFIQSMSINWDVYTKVYNWENVVYLKEHQYLSDITNYLIKLYKEI